MHDPVQNVHLGLCEHPTMPAVEIICPAEGKGPLDRYLQQHKDGLVYHMCFAAKDLTCVHRRSKSRPRSASDLLGPAAAGHSVPGPQDCVLHRQRHGPDRTHGRTSLTGGSVHEAGDRYYRSLVRDRTRVGAGGRPARARHGADRICPDALDDLAAELSTGGAQAAPGRSISRTRRRTADRRQARGGRLLLRRAGQLRGLRRVRSGRGIRPGSTPETHRRQYPRADGTDVRFFPA